MKHETQSIYMNIYTVEIQLRLKKETSRNPLALENDGEKDG